MLFVVTGESRTVVIGASMSRIVRTSHASVMIILRENFAWLNRLTLSLLKQHPAKDSVAMKRRACGWNDEYMLQVLTGISS